MTLNKKLSASIIAAGPITLVDDVVVPEIFTPYVQQRTEEKSRLIQSGVLTVDPLLTDKIAGGGLTFNMPSFRDLDNDEENVSTDDPDDSYSTGDPNLVNNSVPKKILTSQEIAVRLSRNQSWSSADLASALAGADPMEAIANLVSGYWARRLQAAFIATMKGVFANNAKASPGGTAIQNDMIHSIIGGSFVDGVTNFSAEAFLGAALTMGDSQDQLAAVFVHSVVYNRMQNNNLIDFIPDARGEIQIPTFLGREVFVDDSMPSPAAGQYETWLFGYSSVAFGAGSPKVPTEVERKPGAGNGGGQEVLHNRVEWSIHPKGYRYNASAPDGGPSNAATSPNLAHEDSFIRAFPERKQIKIAKLITREA
jgi:hypothetical protein